MDFSEIINWLLYAFSGLCFGSFASRYSVLSVRALRARFAEEGIACIFSCLPQLLFIVTAFLLFPAWFTSRTTTGGFFYYAVLLLFFSKGLRQNQTKN